MVEGEDDAQIRRIAEELRDVLKEEIGDLRGETPIGWTPLREDDKTALRITGATAGHRPGHRGGADALRREA